MRYWTSKDAKARFGELLRKAETEGPQVVTRRGAEAVVVIRVEEWKGSKSRPKLDFMKVLIEDGPKFENIRVRKKRSGLRIVEFG